MTELNTKLREEIIAATQEIFSTMIMMEVGGLSNSQDSVFVNTSNISTMLGLGGEIRGLLAIHFPEDVAIGITSNFLGMAVDGLNDDVRDAIGEIVNMVAGNLKVFLTQNRVQTELAIPTTVIGDSYRTSGLAGAHKVEIPFICKPGSFVVELKYVLNS